VEPTKPSPSRSMIAASWVVFIGVLKQRVLRPCRLNAEVLVGELRDHAAPRRAIQKSNLDQERLVDFLDRVRLLRQGRGQCVHADWPSLVFLNDGEQQFAINFVEAVAVHLKHLQGSLGGGFIYPARAPNLSVVAYTPQQPVGDARGAAGARGDLQRAGFINLHLQDLGRALHDNSQLLRRVELQPQHNPEPRTQRRGQQAGASGGRDKRKRMDIHGVSTGRGSLADDDVQLVILQRRIEQLLQRRLEPMHFVNEQYLVLADVGQNRSEIALDLQRRARGLLEVHAEFMGDDGGQRGLSQSRRAVEQNMVERLAAGTRRLDGHCEVFLHLGLADELLQPLRAQLQLEGSIVFDHRGGDNALAIAPRRVLKASGGQVLIFEGSHSARILSRNCVSGNQGNHGLDTRLLGSGVHYRSTWPALWQVAAVPSAANEIIPLASEQNARPPVFAPCGTAAEL